MPLHPQAVAFCALVNSGGDVELTDDSVTALREGWGLLLSVGAGPAEPVFAVEDRRAAGVPVRVYRPAGATGLPIVVFFHGGGWTIGSVEQYDPVVRQLANRAGAVVVSVDYRLAPEHPFPAAYDDCLAALEWTVEHATELGGDPNRVAVAGDSAGGNLAAVCALRARDAGGPALALQALVYPVTDFDFERPSMVENAKGYFLETAALRWFFDWYTRGGTDPTDPRVSPMREAALTGVAPAVIVTAEFDPLRDEGEAYAQRLRDAGTPVEHRRYDGMVHGFFGLSGTFDASRDAVEFVATALRRAFGTLGS